MSNRGVKIIPKPKAKEENPQGSLTKVVVGVVLGVATLVGGLVVFIPRPTVSIAYQPVDPKNPYSAAFDVANGNIIPLWDTEARVWPGVITNGTKSLIGEGGISDERGGILTPQWQHHDLYGDDKFTVTLSDISPAFNPNSDPLKEADLAIIVDYRPFPLLIRWRRSRAFRFQAHLQTDGHWYWHSNSVK